MMLIWYHVVLVFASSNGTEVNATTLIRSEGKDEMLVEYDERQQNQKENGHSLVRGGASTKFETFSQNVRAGKRGLDIRRLSAEKNEEGIFDEPEFCPNCLWHDGRTCEHRKKQVMERQHKDEEEAIMTVNEPIDGKPSPCLKVLIKGSDATARDVETAKEIETAKEQAAHARAEEIEETEEKDSALLDAYRAIFCGECSWHDNISCAARQQFLHEKYGTPELEGMQVTLEKVDGKCLIEGATLPTDEKTNKFCETCTWAAGIACQHRVQFMMTKYHMTEKDSIEHAMLDGKCTEGNYSR